MEEIKEFVKEKIHELEYLKTNNTLTKWGKGNLEALQKVLYQIECIEERAEAKERSNNEESLNRSMAKMKNIIEKEKVISLESLSNSIDKYR